jgi:hypothetical protein
MDITPEFLAEARENIEEQEARRDVDDSKRVMEIYNDFCTCTVGSRVLRIPQPTLGFLYLYHERQEYFWDDERGVGRLLVALKRQMEGRGQYIRALRCGELIPDEEADEAMHGVRAEDVGVYFGMVNAAEEYGRKETKKKMAKILWGDEAESIESALQEATRSLSNLQGTQLTSSSTKSISEPSTD